MSDNNIAILARQWQADAARIGCQLHGFDDENRASFITPDGAIINVGPKFREALRATPADAEPVAFEYTRRGFLPSVATKVPSYKNIESVRPLYAHPPTDTRRVLEEDVGKIVEAVIDAANITTCDGYYEIDTEAATNAAIRALQPQPAPAWKGDIYAHADGSRECRPVEPQPAPAAERVKMLEEGIERALECTPSIGMWRGLETIVYNGDDPWEILRALLNGGE